MKSSFPYKEAVLISEKLLIQLSPFCSKIEVAGSIRREKQIVGDIEIVAIPLPWQTGLFLDGIGQVIAQWPKELGDVENKSDVRYTKRMLPEGIKLDLFFTTPDNWGPIFLIRTGDWEFSRDFMIRMTRYGLKMENGYVTRGGKMMSVQTEEMMFRLVGLEFIHPRDRSAEYLKNLTKL